MSSFFAILFFLSLILLVWGLISPKSLSQKRKKPITRKSAGLTFGLLTILFSVLSSVTATPQNNKNIGPSGSKTSSSIQQIQSNSPKEASNITKKTVTEKQSIPFEKTTINSPGLATGTTKITTDGVDGEKLLTYEITYTDGKETDKKLIKQEVTKQAVTQVTTIGVYTAPSCANGTYVNSAGNTVCRPEQSSSVPAGATARCVDGSYSFSQSHRGTCSHHGGVAEWL